MNDIALSDIIRNLVDGAAWTLGLSLTAFVLGGIAGLAVLFARIAKHAVPRRLAQAYIEVFQGTPLLMQLFIIFFGGSLIGLEVPPWLAAALGLTFFTSAYLGEIWRGCVESIPKGQWEASASLALTHFEQMRHVILPQAVKIATAPTVGFLVQVVKGTALASVIGFVELTKAGSMISNATFQPFVVFSCVALMYFALCFPISLFAKHLERKTHVRRA